MIGYEIYELVKVATIGSIVVICMTILAATIGLPIDIATGLIESVSPITGFLGIATLVLKEIDGDLSEF